MSAVVCNRKIYYLFHKPHIPQHKLKYYDERVKLSDKIRDLKDSYNGLAKSKAELEEELIRCEEERLNITKCYFRGSHGCIVLFDITNRSSFNNVKT